MDYPTFTIRAFLDDDGIGIITKHVCIEKKSKTYNATVLWDPFGFNKKNKTQNKEMKDDDGNELKDIHEPHPVEYPLI